MSTPTEGIDVLKFALEAGTPGAIALLGWWLSGRFRAIERGYQIAIDTHEAIDQKRHEDNLHAFERIRIALANKGMWNGQN